ncbi:MAG: TIGR04076 family protein [Candidatus Bathyarchaeia archaeon]
MVEKASRLKITVLRRFAPEEVFDEQPVEGGPVETCGVYEDGQVFYVEEDGSMPEGFCGWAWDDIYKDVQTLRFHGDFQWFDEPGVSINCCTDGLRPVVFKIERVD